MISTAASSNISSGDIGAVAPTLFGGLTLYSKDSIIRPRLIIFNPFEFFLKMVSNCFSDVASERI